MKQGNVTSATLMANGPAIGETVREILQYPRCSFGVHLNLTQFSPLTSIDRLAVLLRPSGHFAGNIWNIRIDSALREAIYQEWCAQIEKISSLGVAVSHLDSHHHVHTIPALFPALKSVQKRFGIRKVRISRNMYCSRRPASRALLCLKRVWIFALRYYYHTQTTQGFTGFSSFFILAQRRAIRYGSIELMVHPGSDGYEGETALLRSDWRQRLPYQFELLSYNDL